MIMSLTTRGAGPSWLGAARRPLILAIAGVIVVILISLMTPMFFTAENLLNLGQVVAVLGLVTLAQMLVMVSGGFDLSVGATAGAAFFVVASFGDSVSLGTSLALVLVVAIAIGLVNALLVVARGVPPFVATLGTSIAVFGALTAISQGVFPGTIPAPLRTVSSWHIGPISGSFLVFALAAVAVGIVMRSTTMGRRLVVTGLSPEAARYAEISVGGVRTVIYLVAAVLAAGAGVLLAAYTGFADASAGRTLHLESIAAAVVGGVSLLGGRGGALNAVIGASVMTVVLNVSTLHGLPPESQPIVTGVVLMIGAVIFGVQERRAR
jgi:ribose transport system permease protein